MIGTIVTNGHPESDDHEEYEDTLEPELVKLSSEDIARSGVGGTSIVTAQSHTHSTTTAATSGAAFPTIWSEEGKYLATVLGDALVKGLTQVSQSRPDDPVEYLANYLKEYRAAEGSAPGDGVIASSIPPEVEERLKSGRALTPGVIKRVQERESAALGEESILDQELIDQLDSEGEEDLDDDKDAIHKLEEMDSEGEEAGEEHVQRQSGTRDDRGQSVLHFAAARPGGGSTILAFLQNPSVNLAWRDEKLRTARDIAEGIGRAENLRVIDGWICSLAVAGDKTSLLQLALDGYHPLHDISNGGSSKDSSHIIDLAEKAGKRDVALVLRALPDFRERLGKLHQAIRTGDLEGVKKLAMASPDGRFLAIGVGPWNGRTALHVAVLAAQFSIVKWLCEKFGNNEKGQTDFGGVGGGGEEEGVVGLNVLKRGDHLDRTPLHYAMGLGEGKVEKMTRILVRNGAKRVVKDLMGRQPSYYFINREEIVNLQREEEALKDSN